MKKHINLLLLTMIAILSMHQTFANIKITFKPFGVAKSDACSQIPGRWTGQGVAKGSYWGIDFECDYAGTANIKGTKTMTANINVHKTGGSLLCPKGEPTVLNGTCRNGQIEVVIQDVDLFATTDGHTMTFDGHFEDPIKADVHIDGTKS